MVYTITGNRKEGRKEGKREREIYAREVIFTRIIMEGEGGRMKHAPPPMKDTWRSLKERENLNSGDVASLYVMIF